MKAMKAILIIIMIVSAVALSYLLTSGVVWIVCWAFSLQFSWKVSFAIWVIVGFLLMAFASSD